ncbi:MAG: GumC family protein [Novosphingobium sp.]
MATSFNRAGASDLDAEFAQFEEQGYGVAPGYGENKLFDLRQILAILRANALVILTILLAAVGFAVVSTMMETPQYTATATMQINDQGDRVLEKGEVSAGAADSWDPERFLQTQMDILRSRSLAERVEQSLKLRSDAAFFQAMGLEPPGPGLPQDVARKMAAGMLAGSLRTNLPRNSRIVSVSFVSNSPEQSARIANAYVKEFIAANLQRKYDSSAYARGFIADQLAETKQKLEASEVALNGYAREADLLRTTTSIGADGNEKESQTVTGASLSQLNAAANEARASRIVAESRWRAFSSSAPLASPEVLANPSIQQLLTQRGELRTKLEQERARHLDGHPTVIQLKAQADETDRQISALIGTVRASIRSQYQAALATERDLQGQVNRLKNESMAEGDRSVQYNILAREVSTNRELYEGLLQRYKELNAAAGISASNVALIDSATPPGGPSSPNLAANIFMALVIGAAVAGLIVLLRLQFDDAVRIPEDVEQKLRVPLLGVIPLAEQELGEALADPKSPVSEAYNSLGGSLLYSTADGLPKVMLITSAQSTEGKSTTSFAIASNFARIAKRVVLVDVDLRRPSLHKRLGLANDEGMTSLLTSLDPVESAISATDQPGLSVITSGPLPPSPTELIASGRMRAVLEELASKFDVVVVDSPPVLGLADAPLMAALSDGVVIVIEADRGRRGTLKTALRRLRAMRPVILGAVLTKFDSRKMTNSYSDYYGYDYYQYESDGSKPRRGPRTSP